MTKMILSTLLLLFMGGAIPALGKPAPAPPVRTLAEGNNRFALSLYLRLRSRQENLFFSPMSLTTALGMVYAGSRGRTAQEMARVLYFPNDRKILSRSMRDLTQVLKKKSEGVELTIANALWGQKGYNFLKSYWDVLQTSYSAGLFEADFQKDTEGARQAINEWTEQNTENRIKELLKPGILKPATQLVLTNAIYFNGKWKTPFRMEETKEDAFFLLSGTKVAVPLMFREGLLPYGEEKNCQIIELPYGENDFSMLLFLPQKQAGLPELEKSLTQEKLKPALSKKKVRVFLPKFVMESEFSLAETLQAMGMKIAFSPAADFTGMSPRRDLRISAVIHKAFVDVGEEGTEASAATAVVMTKMALPVREPVKVFRADHPFLFLIRHNASGSTLFMGRMMNPAGK
ncbi:MAG: serpin family protein [bacterium]